MRLHREDYFLHLLLAVDAAISALGHLGGHGQLLLGLADALGIVTNLVIHPAIGVDGFPQGILLGFVQKLQNQRHAHQLAVVGLTEISGTGIIVHLDGDLVDAGQGMQHGHIFLGMLHLLSG